MGMKSVGNLCAACQGLPLSQAFSNKHDLMNKLSERQSDCGRTQKTLYQCFSCKTLWLHEQNQWGACLGFKLWHSGLDEFNRTRTPLPFIVNTFHNPSSSPNAAFR